MSSYYPIAGNGGYTGNDNAASDNVSNMKNTQNEVVVVSQKKTYAVVLILVCLGWYFWGRA
ncbi:hypothetical protein [Vibrio sp. HN007]|uniref:hypothetical protein n=1 Tax=Vibrio iocasae TaxID=3098914 RepID=UPI0035D4084A